MAVSDLLGIGASGTRAYRAAMGAVSENISNATTEGYNRRAVVLGESLASATTSQVYKAGVAFGGVDIVSVVRRTDEYLDLAARSASSKYESANARATWLGNVQSAMDDGALGVGKQLTTMFSAVERLASNPTDTTLRTNVLFAVDQVNTAFKQTAEGLQNVKAGILTVASSDVDTLNNAVERLATANEALRRSIPGSSNAAQLLDQRDQALVDISKKIDVTVTFGNSGVANVTYGGADVVNNVVPSTFAVTAAADGQLSFTLDGAAVALPKTGSLEGLATSAKVNADRIQAVDDLAAQYVTDMNTWHKAGFVSLSPNEAGGDIVSGTDAASLAMVLSDPAKLATYSADGRVNGNLVAVSDIRGTNSVENGWTAIISTHANLLSATNAERSAAATRDEQAQAARGDVSGVDLDREAADLMRLQQAYQGCARIIQVARETFDTLLQAF